MASNPTDYPQEDSGADSNSFDGEGDKTKGKEGDKSWKRRIMNSKAIVKVVGKKTYPHGVSPAPKETQPPAHVKASTPKRSSDPKHHPQSGATGTGHKKHSSASAGEHQQHQWAPYTMPAPPRQDQRHTHTSSPTEQTFERQRPTTSSHSTHAPAKFVIQQQPRLSSHQQQQQVSPVGGSIMYDHLQTTTAQVGSNSTFALRMDTEVDNEITGIVYKRFTYKVCETFIHDLHNFRIKQAIATGPSPQL